MTNAKAKLMRRDKHEVLFYIFCWVLVLAIPLFRETYSLATGRTSDFDWVELGLDYYAFIPFFICFFLGKHFFEPHYFFTGRYKLFFTYTVVSTLLITLLFSSMAPDRRHREIKQFHRQHEQALARAHTAEDSLALMPPALHPDEWSPEPPGNLPEGIPRPPKRGPHHRGFFHGPFVPMLVMTMFMLAASLGVSIVFRHRREELEHQEKQAARLQSELDYLKYQINPHFFMNTLNNIHALVDIDSELAKEAIIELSRMMRYLLYESNQPTVPLSKELSFVQHYIELMRLRCDESVTLTYQQPAPGTIDLGAGIPPMLLISFIENAFKHGISHQKPSYIRVAMSSEDGKFHFTCSNSNFSTESNIQQQGGVGLDNVRKRLELIYPGQHTLQIVPSETDFTVDLWIPLSKLNK